MCGIAGILRTFPSGIPVPAREESIPETWLDVLDDSIKHRGPDGNGRFRDRVLRSDGRTVDVALVHRRLAIIDRRDGHQPMLLRREEAGAADQVAVVFNGCIYNHRELREELEVLGARFQSDHSDTEVLLHGWKQWGNGLVPKLEGMFAVAIWDRQSGELTCARDAFGEKPLWQVWTQAGREFLGPEARAFASCPAGLLRLSEVTTQQHVEFSPPEWSMRDWIKSGTGEQVGAVRSLEIGTCTFETSRMPTPPVTWTQVGLAALSKPEAGGFKERTRTLTAGEVEAALEASVAKRLEEADDEVGCFLSGGVDSSLIAALAARYSKDVRTFCMRMPSHAYDESGFAEQVARYLGLRHVTLDVSPRPAEDLVDLIEGLGVPFADSSLLPTSWLARATRDEVGIALSGDGGDELFAGYDRHRAAALLARWGGLLALMPQWLLRNGNPRSRLERLGRLAHAARSMRGASELAAIFDDEQMLRLAGHKGALGSENIPKHTAFGLVHHAVNTHESVTSPAKSRGMAVSRALEHDLKRYLPHDLLVKADTASMRWALEVRAPFLDSHVSALARSATIESLMPGGERKGLLRAVARKHVPRSIVDRPKMGFAIPLTEWFREDFGGMRTLLGDLVIASSDPFPIELLGTQLDRTYIRQIFDQHMSGTRDHAQRLYVLLVMAIWCRWYQRIRRNQSVR